MLLAMPATSHMGKKLTLLYEASNIHKWYVYSDKPYSKFKPGQVQLERDYYSKAT